MGTKNGVYGAGRFLYLVAAVFCVWSLGACSSYHGRSVRIKQSLLEADYQSALENIEGIDQGNAGLLYFFEKGLILHYQNDYKSSNEAFEQVENLLEELYTKSVTRELAALAVTDNITKYRGDPFEAVLVNYYKILNYLHVGETEGALVECRRVNHKLQMLIDSGETYFTNDPFLQYFTGMVYSMAGEYTEAEVSFRVAADAYSGLQDTYHVETPGLLYCDAAETARILGDWEAAELYASKTDCDSTPSAAQSGAINLFLECGYVAHKEEENIVLPIYGDDDYDDREAFAVTLAGRRGLARRSGVKLEYLLRVAMPVLESTPVSFDYAEIRSVDKSPAAEEHEGFNTKTVLVENLDALARKAFQEKEGKILVRAIVRGLAKYAAKKGADKKNEGLGILVNIFNVATESADTRTWSTLPEKILMGRLVLPEGVYDLKINLYRGGGNKTDSFTIPDVEVRNGQTSFINHRVF